MGKRNIRRQRPTRPDARPRLSGDPADGTPEGPCRTEVSSVGVFKLSTTAAPVMTPSSAQKSVFLLTCSCPNLLLFFLFFLQDHLLPTSKCIFIYIYAQRNRIKAHLTCLFQSLLPFLNNNISLLSTDCQSFSFVCMEERCWFLFFVGFLASSAVTHKLSPC